MSNGRSYQSKRTGQFSYLEQRNAQACPTVWIVHADDQPRARNLLREVRLLETTRHDLPNVEYTFREGENGSSTNARSWAWRIRLVLLLVIAALVMFVTMRHRSAPPLTPATQPAAQQTPAQNPSPPPADEVRVRIRPAR